jgi:hypothetical protein
MGSKNDYDFHFCRHIGSGRLPALFIFTRPAKYPAEKTLFEIPEKFELPQQESVAQQEDIIDGKDENVINYFSPRRDILWAEYPMQYRLHDVGYGRSGKREYNQDDHYL